MVDSVYGENIQKALKIQYGNIVVNKFVDYIQTEEFDQETIESDIRDDDDVLDCSIAVGIIDTLPALFNDENKKKLLLIILKNALDGIMPIKQIKQIDVNAIKWIVNKNEIKKAQTFISTHCAELMAVKEKKDTALLEVIAIGQKNEIPLLNWLTDTWSRYRVNNWLLKQKDIHRGNWITEYLFFKQLKSRNKQKVLEKLNSSIQSFYTRMFNSINLKESLVQIDDNINEFIDYFFVMNSVIERLVSENEVAPCQIDMWIIPKHAITALEESTLHPSASNDDDSDESDEDDDDGNDNIGVDVVGNIDYRLKSNKFTFEKKEGVSLVNMDYSKTIRQLTKSVENVVNGERRQRIIIYVDRRNPKQNKMSSNDFKNYVKNGYKVDDEKNNDIKSRSNEKKTWKDNIYIVQPEKKEYKKLPDQNTPETSFWSSVQCMVPIIEQERTKRKNVDYGVRYDFNGLQFTISWQIDSADQIRCYWFTNCWGVRLFPSDCTKLWPLVFKNAKIDKKRIEVLNNINQIKDDQFEQWYKKTTGKPLLVN